MSGPDSSSFFYLPNKDESIIQLPDFEKEEEELSSERDKWFYVLKHMSKMEKMPKFLDKRVFRLIFKIGEVSKLKKEERMAYEASLKAKWDNQNAFDSVRRDAVRDATEKKSYEVVENLINQTTFDDNKIAQLVVVDLDFVQKVRADLAKKKN